MTDVQSCRARLRTRLIDLVRSAGVPVPDMAARLGVAPEPRQRWRYARGEWASVPAA